MTTESKKLPIFDALVFPGRLVDCVRASDHGRIVHAQREVIRQQDEALARAENCMRKAMRYMGSSPDSPVAKDLAFVREIRAAAAPYIQED